MLDEVLPEVLEFSPKEQANLRSAVRIRLDAVKKDEFSREWVGTCFYFALRMVMPTYLGQAVMHSLRRSFSLLAKTPGVNYLSHGKRMTLVSFFMFGPSPCHAETHCRYRP